MAGNNQNKTGSTTKKQKTANYRAGKRRVGNKSSGGQGSQANQKSQARRSNNKPRKISQGESRRSYERYVVAAKKVQRGEYLRYFLWSLGFFTFCILYLHYEWGAVFGDYSPDILVGIILLLSTGATAYNLFYLVVVLFSDSVYPSEADYRHWVKGGVGPGGGLVCYNCGSQSIRRYMDHETGNRYCFCNRCGVRLTVD